ncbi:hypothetical protein ACFLXI_02770 [Chloroflexota bacterium]
MTTPLLATKLYVPSPSPDLVPRVRLNEQLNTGLSRKLTLVSAPAGFGKTTLLSAWIQEVRSVMPVAWLSLENADDDLTRFLTYFVAALQTIESNIGQKILAAFQSPGLPNSEIVLTTLINEIAEYHGDLVLILDDYHMIESKSIGQALNFILEHLPGNMHLVISTRVDPPLPLARLRARGQMTELRTTNLRFTSDEITVFLNQVMNLGLSAEDIAALESRTEGWISGLQLAALSLQDKDDVTGFIRSFTGSHHHILNYLLEEVLNQQSPDVQSFLLQTSILKRLTGPLCDAVCTDETGPDSGQSTLERLTNSNLFIVPLDDERRWYRYHHLFADLLQARLKRLQPGLMNTLHLRAVEWFDENGFITEAVNHAFSASDYDRAASIIERVASGTLLQGRLTTILGWLDTLPYGILDARPRLRFYHAWSLAIAGQPKIADKILLDARSSLETKPVSPENLALRGELAALRTGIIIYHNNPDEIIQEATEAFTYLPEDNVISRSRVYMALGTAYAYKDEMQKALETYERGRDLALNANAPFLATANIELLTEPLAYQLGRLKDAAENLTQILALGKAKDGTYQAFTGAAHVLLAEINLEWNNYVEASRYLEKGFELLRLGGSGTL